MPERSRSPALANGAEALPQCDVPGESTRYIGAVTDLMTTPGDTGPRVQDATLAANWLIHGASEPWTAFLDFGCFPRLRTRNPAVD